jgi:hypothetical protein
MAAVEVTITGTLYDKHRRTTQQVVLIGEASLTGVGIGGGPMPGGPGGGPGGPVDPGWGYPERPVDPAYGIPITGRPHPEHPIYFPPVLTPPDPPAGGTKPPPEGEGGWGFYDGRWGYFPGPTQPGPKS